MFELYVSTGGAAFEEGSPSSELARLLRLAAERVAAGEEQGVLLDSNGNRVGEFSLRSGE